MQLYLADLAALTEDQIKEHIAVEYSGSATAEYLRGMLENYDIVVAYESVGSWGCDSSSWFLLREKNTGLFYETHGSHCSCYGFEDQFNLELAPIEYLTSDRFRFNTGGYDDNAIGNQQLVLEFLAKLITTEGTPMSRIVQQNTITTYTIGLDTMRDLIAEDLKVPAEELVVEYVIGDTGPGDPMDRYPAPRGVVGIKVTRTVK